MTDLHNPHRGNNTPLSKNNGAAALRLFELQKRFGINGPYARMICELAFGAPSDGGCE